MGPLSAGDALAGRFRLIRPLGQGAAGEVWLAEETAAQRRVALKFGAPGADPALLRAEFDQARRLVHPGIVRLHELVEGPPAFLVLQYVPGANAGSLRGSGFRAVVAALVPVADALEYAHRQGVIHRDLKASNVLRDERGQCLVADFGLGGARTGGSPPAMSPQQLAGLPAAVSDDVYGFGALLYDLIAGEPLFHPDVTPGRIRGETPVIPVADLTGEPLPEALRRLAGAMLQKAPEQRPPGMAAVRSALEDILRDNPARTGSTGDGVILPRERSRPAAAAASDAGTAAALPPVPPGRARAGGLPAAAVYAGLAFFAVLAVAVVVYLPSLVRERGPLVRVTEPEAPPPVADASATPAAYPPVPQDVLDQTLGEFLHSDDELRKLNADKWGGADWAELRRIAQAGDEAYQRRDAGTALASYRTAATLAKSLLAHAPDVLAGALRDGEAALAAGDQARAIAQFETALAVSPDDARARHGLERARKLDKVLALMGQATAAEAAGERITALGLYRQAAALDPAWAAASAGVARLEQAAARDVYETQMARAFAAQAGNDLGAARAAFEAALRVRPGDPQAKAALAQIDTDQNLARLSALQAQARALERDERWAEALERYDAVMAADPNIADARQGQERARGRLDLDQRLRRELGNADRFNDDAVFGKARALLEAARGVADPGPVLRQQVAELDRLLQVAATPVSVTLESDNLTEVTVFKVGRLGAFATRTLALRPGAYTVVGSRAGYRDVRLTVRVAPGSNAAPVVVRCEEAI